MALIKCTDENGRPIMRRFVPHGSAPQSPVEHEENHISTDDRAIDTEPETDADSESQPEPRNEAYLPEPRNEAYLQDTEDDSDSDSEANSGSDTEQDVF
jgi:hypothetical protein